MKAKFYFLLLTLICFSFNGSAQDFIFNTMTLEDWNNSGWKKLSRVSNTYNGDGILIKQEGEAWDSISNAWIKQSIMTNTLNSNSTIAESLTKMWDPDLKNWIDMYKTQYTYNTSKKVLSSLTFVDLGNGWRDFTKRTLEYDSNNLLIKETDQGFNPIIYMLANVGQTTYTYNADLTENQSIQQDWNSTLSLWVNDSRSTSSYNTSKKVTSILYESFVSSLWVNDSKTIFSYNADGTYKETLDQIWNSQAVTWDNDIKDIYTINSNQSIDMILSQKWNTGSLQWINDSRVTFTYPITDIENRVLPDQQSISVYPNPFTGEINIENSREYPLRFGIYNATGQMVYSSATNGSKTRVNLNSLGKGTYFLKLNSGNNKQSFKLLKIR